MPLGGRVGCEVGGGQRGAGCSSSCEGVACQRVCWRRQCGVISRGAYIRAAGVRGHEGGQGQDTHKRHQTAAACSVFVFWLSCMSPPPSLPSPRLLNATVSCFSAASHPSFSDLSRDPAPPRPHAHSPSPPPHPFTSSSLSLSPPSHHGPPKGCHPRPPTAAASTSWWQAGVFTRPYHHVMLLRPLPTPAFLRSPITTIGTS